MVNDNSNTQTKIARLRHWAHAITREAAAVHLAARDPRVPWFAKAVAACVAAYALSPIDLIPDFIPVLGHLDDLIIVPLGIALAVRLIPPQLMAEHRQAAASTARPDSFAGAAAIITVWTTLTVAASYLAYRSLSP
jgi:uncharacterized membrane protein YkvA (DUF1232 family)